MLYNKINHTKRHFKRAAGLDEHLASKTGLLRVLPISL